MRKPVFFQQANRIEVLLVETEGHDEICIVVNGCCYQIEDEKKIIERERDERWH